VSRRAGATSVAAALAAVVVREVLLDVRRTIVRRSRLLVMFGAGLALAAAAACSSPGAQSPAASASSSASAAPAGARSSGAKTALTWDNIFKSTRGARQSVLSPDGSTVAVAGSSAADSGIFLVSTKGEAEPTLLVKGGSNPVWFPDGKRVLYSAQNDLWAIDLAAKTPVRVTNDPDNERAAAVSPDGQTVAFYSTRSKSQDIWLVPAAGGTPKALTMAAMTEDDTRFAPAWAPDGKSVAYISNKADFWADDVWVSDVATGKARQVSKGMMAMSLPVWSPDGKSIALLGVGKKIYWYEDLSDIYIVDATTGAERTVKMQMYATDSLHNLPVFWSGDGSQIFFCYQERGVFNLWAVPTAGGVATRISNLEGSLRSIDASAKGDAFTFVYTTPTRGPDVEYISATGGPSKRLTTFAEEWEGVTAPQEVAYRSFDGLYIQGFLYLPPGLKAETKSSTKYPSLVMVHGGGTNSYLRTQNLNEQYFASKGYVVLAINYRGGSGFGRAFQDLSVNKWASDEALDAGAAADFMRTLPYASGKVGIYGYSYGGIMSMAAITRVPEKFDAAVPMAGIYDFADAYKGGDRVQKIFTMTGHGGPPEKRRAVYDLSDSLARIPNIKTPLLIMHGEADIRAPYHQYELAVASLKQHNKVFESKSYPGEPHGFRNPANRVDMYQRAEAFLDRYLKGSGAGTH
jgi:dipeptidyl aminopeptidase/acylaminoacyl peptidase